jgi:hypothetical protein
MDTLFSNPRNWTGQMVKTWMRFWFMGLSLTAFIVYAVYSAASWGLRSGMAAALFVVLFQFYMLYALRRLYFQTEPGEGKTNAV